MSWYQSSATSEDLMRRLSANAKQCSARLSLFSAWELYMQLPCSLRPAERAAPSLTRTHYYNLDRLLNHLLPSYVRSPLALSPGAAQPAAAARPSMPLDVSLECKESQLHS